jgi:galactokinase
VASFPITDPPVRLLAAFQQAFPEQAPQWILRAPGRDVWIAAVASPSAHFTVASPDHESRTAFNLRSAKNKRTLVQRPLPRWAYYPAGVIFILCNSGMDMAGLNMVVLSEEPPGPGYDYGVGMAFVALWYEIHAQPYSTDTLLDVVDRVRREYVEV